MRKFTMYPRRYVRGTTIGASEVIWRSGDGSWYIEEIEMDDGYSLYDIIHRGIRFKTECSLSKALRTANMYAA